jgi:hypothetical protein
LWVGQALGICGLALQWKTNHALFREMVTRERHGEKIAMARRGERSQTSLRVA